MSLTILPGSGLRVTWQWRTDVIQHADGSEQRICTRTPTHPRAFYVGPLFLSDSEARTAHQILSAGPEGTYELPLVHEAVAALAAVTGTALSVTATHCEWIAVGRRLLIVGPGSRFTASIAGFVGGAITLNAGPSSGTYPAGVTHVYPLEDVLLEDGQSIDRQPVNASRWTISGRQSTARALLGTGAAALSTHGALPVLDVRPLGADATRTDGGLRFIDAGGAISSSTLYTRSSRLRRGEFPIGTAAERQRWKLFIVAIGGMWKPFLWPTWRPDLVLYEQPTPTAYTIRVAPGYNDDWYPSLAHRRLQLEYADGTVGYFAVVSVVETDPAYETITLLTAIPGSLPGGSVSVVSFLELCRGAEDEVAVEYGAGWQGRSTLGGVVHQSATDLIRWPTSAAELRTALGGYGTWASAWQLDGPAAPGTLADAWGGITLTPSSSPTYQNAGALTEADKAVGFDSAQDRFETALAATFDVDASTSIAAYTCAKFTVSAQGYCVGKVIGAGANYWMLVGVLNASGHLYAQVFNGVSGPAAIIAVNHNDGRFHDVIATIDRSANLLTITSDLGSDSVSIAAIGTLANAKTMHLGGTSTLGAAVHLQAFTAIATGDVTNLRTNAAAAIASIRRWTGRA